MVNEDAYLKYASGFSDDELQAAIKNPDDYGQDIYNAILAVALERQLITQEKYDNSFWPDTSGFAETMEAEEPQINVNADDFWKCPQCGQTIEIVFDACWNCQAEKPKQIEHPAEQEIIEYQIDRKPFNFLRTGSITILSGILILAISYLLNRQDFIGFHYLPVGKYILGSAIIIIGIIIILNGVSKQAKG